MHLKITGDSAFCFMWCVCVLNWYLYILCMSNHSSFTMYLLRGWCSATLLANMKCISPVDCFCVHAHVSSVLYHCATGGDCVYVRMFHRCVVTFCDKYYECDCRRLLSIRNTYIDLPCMQQGNIYCDILWTVRLYSLFFRNTSVEIIKIFFTRLKSCFNYRDCVHQWSVYEELQNIFQYLIDTPLKK